MKPSFVICNDKQEYLHLVQFYDGIVPIVWTTKPEAALTFSGQGEAQAVFDEMDDGTPLYILQLVEGTVWAVPGLPAPDWCKIIPLPTRNPN
jgi:hypothetical protein